MASVSTQTVWAFEVVCGTMNLLSGQRLSPCNGALSSSLLLHQSISTPNNLEHIDFMALSRVSMQALKHRLCASTATDLSSLKRPFLLTLSSYVTMDRIISGVPSCRRIGPLRSNARSLCMTSCYSTIVLCVILEGKRCQTWIDSMSLSSDWHAYVYVEPVLR